MMMMTMMSSPSITTSDTASGLAGAVAIVTGGSRGIGRAVVHTLASAGMEVDFTYRENAAAAEEVVSAVPDAEITAEAVDVRDAEACASFAEKVFDRSGRIDLLVNNAGVIRDNPLGALEPPDVSAVLQTNVEGTFNMTRAVVPFMISQRRGKIVNISSVSGEKGGRGQTNYAASKGAINAFTRSLAVEVAPRGITVNAVAPGVIETEMSRAVRDLAGDQIKSRILLRRFGRPEEVAHAVWFLSSRYADYITGQILNVDGGFKME
jgi:3-oxoacyl-[acyl-carrier protein] reductase